MKQITYRLPDDLVAEVKRMSRQGYGHVPVEVVRNAIRAAAAMTPLEMLKWTHKYIEAQQARIAAAEEAARQKAEADEKAAAEAAAKEAASPQPRADGLLYDPLCSDEEAF